MILLNSIKFNVIVVFLVILLYVLFAAIFTIAKIGLEHAQPLFFVGSRATIAGILMLAYQYITHREAFKFKRADLWHLFLLAIFNIYLTNVLEFWGLQHLTSSKTSFLYSLSPFISALFSYFIFSETLTGKKWLGLAIGFSGCLPLLLSTTHGEAAGGQFWIFSWAELAVLTAVISSVYGWILLRQLVKDKSYTPLMANGSSMLLGGILALTHSSLTETWNPLPITHTIPFLECAFLLILISNLIAYNLYGSLLKKYSATFMSFAGLTTPLFTALFGWLFLNEYTTWSFFISGSIVFSGLLIFYQEELRASIRKKVAV
jgi:drug/metabolite transporter (DMT)-like permease